MKIRNYLFVFLMAFWSLSVPRLSQYSLLNKEDMGRVSLEVEHGPALSAPLDALPRWESFNNWFCFSTENIQLECTEILDTHEFVPTVSVTRDSIRFDFSLDAEPVVDCANVKANWEYLLQDQPSFCVFAAFLQNSPPDDLGIDAIKNWSIWITRTIKSKKGYWDAYEYQEQQEEQSLIQSFYGLNEMES